jgi:hypothetical protein
MTAQLTRAITHYRTNDGLAGTVVQNCGWCNRGELPVDGDAMPLIGANTLA